MDQKNSNEVGKGRRLYQWDYAAGSVKQRAIDGTILFTGLASERPENSPLTEKVFWYATDTNVLSIWNAESSAWDTVGGSGTITGTGSAGQAVIWTGASTVYGSNNFLFDEGPGGRIFYLGEASSNSDGKLVISGSSGNIATQLLGTSTGLEFSLDGGTTVMKIGTVDSNTLGIYGGGGGSTVDLEFKAASGKKIGLGANNQNPFSGFNGVVLDTTNYVGIGDTAPETKLHLNQVQDVSGGAVTDGYSAAETFEPGYDGNHTVTRHNYMNVKTANLSSGATVTDGAVMRFDANAGTHIAVDSGATKTSPGTVDAYIKVNINGTIYYIPAYTSKTS